MAVSEGRRTLERVKWFLAAMVVAALALPAPAQAEDPNADHRRCVSNREFNSLGGYIDRNGRVTKAEVEERWEVVGRGVPGTLALVGSATFYKRCGHPMSESWFAVVYYHGSVWMQGWPPDDTTGP